MPKVRMPRTDGEDEIVVIDFHIGRSHFSRLDIHRFHFREDDLHVSALAQYRAHRSCDVGWRKRSCRDLIEQRLKEMVICAVDYREAHIFTRKLFGCFQPAKARADDDDVWSFYQGIFHTGGIRQTFNVQHSIHWHDVTAMSA